MGEKITRAISLFLLAVIIPYVMTICINGYSKDSGSMIKKVDTGRDVIINIDNVNQLIDVEEYIAGVLPGLVDSESGDEVLEAQAVAVRTKIYYQMGENTVINAEEMEFVYYTKKDYINKWGPNKYQKIQERYNRAVINTVSKIIE